VSLDGEKKRQKRCKTVSAIQYLSLSSVKYSHNRTAPVWPSLFEKLFEVQTYFVNAKSYY